MQGDGSGLGSEDCLYLAVHVPAALVRNASARAPVLLYIHGGGLMAGCGQVHVPLLIFIIYIIICVIIYIIIHTS